MVHYWGSAGLIGQVRRATVAQMSVLVADPDPGACLLCARSLQLQEHQVIQATDGREALVKALSTNPSIFITETVLPFIDGYSLCEVLRNDAAMTSVPILVA